jgi:hypothetical protein
MDITGEGLHTKWGGEESQAKEEKLTLTAPSLQLPDAHGTKEEMESLCERSAKSKLHWRIMD